MPTPSTFVTTTTATSQVVHPRDSGFTGGSAVLAAVGIAVFVVGALWMRRRVFGTARSGPSWRRFIFVAGPLAVVALVGFIASPAHLSLWRQAAIVAVIVLVGLTIMALASQLRAELHRSAPPLVTYEVNGWSIVVTVRNRGESDTFVFDATLRGSTSTHSLQWAKTGTHNTTLPSDGWDTVELTSYSPLPDSPPVTVECVLLAHNQPSFSRSYSLRRVLGLLECHVADEPWPAKSEAHWRGPIRTLIEDGRAVLSAADVIAAPRPEAASEYQAVKDLIGPYRQRVWDTRLVRFADDPTYQQLASDSLPDSGMRGTNQNLLLAWVEYAHGLVGWLEDALTHETGTFVPHA